MAAEIIDGKKIAVQILGELRERITKKRMTPGLGVVLVGEDAASLSYVASKAKACAQVGIHEETVRLPAEVGEREILGAVEKLNLDPQFHGVLVQLPLPPHIDEERVLPAISPEKDVDCFHPINVGLLLLGRPNFLPCTPHAVQQLLARSGYPPDGKHVVICGRSNVVGKGLAAMLVQKKEGANATVTVCHTGTENLGSITLQADILIAAMGQPRMIKADMVKEGAVVIDVGINRIPDASRKRGYRLVGDVDFDNVREKAGAVTPVPGGVGPMTVAMLIFNTVLAAERA
jgi:methylenetetrahydrofolate dehydrogenase (NADP+)/methenyltetrahydrofolate cyclohydrolase